MACAKKERSLADLSRSFGQPIQKLHFHVMKLMDAKLLSVSRVERRPGRPIRYYKAVSDAFLLSQEAMKPSVSSQFAKELRQSLESARPSDVSVLYSVDDRGRIIVRAIPAKPKPARAQEFWTIVRLSTAQREMLAAEMKDLIARYGAASAGSRGAELLLVHAAFAPKRKMPSSDRQGADGIADDLRKKARIRADARLQS